MGELTTKGTKNTKRRGKWESYRKDGKSGKGEVNREWG